jgi:hypothetical protein
VLPRDSAPGSLGSIPKLPSSFVGWYIGSSELGFCVTKGSSCTEDASARSLRRPAGSLPASGMYVLATGCLPKGGMLLRGPGLGGWGNSPVLLSSQMRRNTYLASEQGRRTVAQAQLHYLLYVRACGNGDCLGLSSRYWVRRPGRTSQSPRHAFDTDLCMAHLTLHALSLQAWAGGRPQWLLRAAGEQTRHASIWRIWLLQLQAWAGRGLH